MYVDRDYDRAYRLTNGRNRCSSFGQFSRQCCSSLFFFSSRRRHTRLQGDWSSDVCSSDLTARASDEERVERQRVARMHDGFEVDLRVEADEGEGALLALGDVEQRQRDRGGQIGRASCRERV